MTTTPLSVPKGPHPGIDEDFSKEDVPTGVAPWAPRIAATIVDLAIVLLPLGIGWSIVASLRDANGGGEADRFVFGAIALSVALGLFLWNQGFRDGNEGQSTGKRWTNLVVRDLHTGDPIGVRRALLRPFGLGTASTEVVRQKRAIDELFTP
ncbi:MAG: RDD family protein, partial [Rhodococcus sp. (in: high G+C Gram-positive bacteria)]